VTYDAWRTDAPDPGTVEDRCDQCGIDLFPEEREDGRCGRCTADAYALQAEDEQDAA